MERKCPYCGSTIDEKSQYCHICGTPLDVVQNKLGQKPQTIEELQAWYTAHNLPPENVTRFFIGKDIKEARAFGIYKNSAGEFVVYKNKSNGERAVRYQGYDEGYAVNELYQRLKAEIADQKSHSASNRASQTRSYSSKKSGSSLAKIFGFFVFTKVGLTILVMIITFLVAALDKSPSRGYYRYGGNDYYYQSGSWYSYDSDYDSWDYVYDDDFLDDVIYDDTASDYRVYDHDGMDFEDTSWYDTGSSSSSYDSSDYSYDYDWDSSYDSDWDSDWDSGSDWGSDWDSDSGFDYDYDY